MRLHKALTHTLHHWGETGIASMQPDDAARIQLVRHCGVSNLQASCGGSVQQSETSAVQRSPERLAVSDLSPTSAGLQTIASHQLLRCSGSIKAATGTREVSLSKACFAVLRGNEVLEESGTLRFVGQGRYPGATLTLALVQSRKHLLQQRAAQRQAVADKPQFLLQTFCFAAMATAMLAATPVCARLGAAPRFRASPACSPFTGLKRGVRAAAMFQAGLICSAADSPMPDMPVTAVQAAAVPAAEGSGRCCPLSID